MDVSESWEFEKCNFHLSFLNWNISVNNKGKLMKFVVPVVENHSEETVSNLLFR